MGTSKYQKKIQLALNSGASNKEDIKTYFKEKKKQSKDMGKRKFLSGEGEQEYKQKLKKIYRIFNEDERRDTSGVSGGFNEYDEFDEFDDYDVAVEKQQMMHSFLKEYFDDGVETEWDKYNMWKDSVLEDWRLSRYYRELPEFTVKRRDVIPFDIASRYYQLLGDLPLDWDVEIMDSVISETYPFNNDIEFLKKVFTIMVAFCKFMNEFQPKKCDVFIKLSQKFKNWAIRPQKFI